MQPRHPVAEAPASEPLPSANLELALSGVADLPVAGSVIALPAERWNIDPWTWLLGIAAAGVVVRLAWLAMGLVRLGRLGRSAHRIAPPEPAREFLTRFGLSAAFVQPPDVRMPCSFGLFRPTVVLPAAFDRLEPGFQRDVVCHELAHLERRDFVATLVEEAVAALLWFHPWVWLVRRRIRPHREQAVDAAVVRRTGDRRAYVRCPIASSRWRGIRARSGWRRRCCGRRSCVPAPMSCSRRRERCRNDGRQCSRWGCARCWV